jgi:hypothetical protein
MIFRISRLKSQAGALSRRLGIIGNYIYDNLVWDIFAGIPALALIGRGLWLIYEPATYLFLGAILGALYVIHAMAETKGTRK